MDSLLRPPLCFAHRGARAELPDNTLEAFERAVVLGATGLESDVWATRDGVPVLLHDMKFWDERVWYRLRKRNITKRDIGEIPDSIPTVAKVLELAGNPAGSPLHVSLDIKDERRETIANLLDVVRVSNLPAHMVWLCSTSLDVLSAVREEFAEVRLVHSTRIRHLKKGPERHAAELAERDIQTANFHSSDWTPGLITLYHRFDRYCFSWDNQIDRVLREQLTIGIDGVYSDHVARMMLALKEVMR